jgi:hypothetical protein
MRFIYTRALTTVKLASVPYVNIIIGLALILVPVAIGMLITNAAQKKNHAIAKY